MKHGASHTRYKMFKLNKNIQKYIKEEEEYIKYQYKTFIY